jgi:prevent-host-death family protein
MTISVKALQERFRAVLDEVTHEHTPYVLTRRSRPEAVLISYKDFLRYQALQEQEILARFDARTARLARHLAERNADYTDEEVADDIEAVVAEVRAGLGA